MLAIGATLLSRNRTLLLSQHMRQRAIVTYLRDRFNRSDRSASLELCRGNLGQSGVALLGICRLLSGRDGRRKLARRQLGLQVRLRLFTPGGGDGQGDQSHAHKCNQSLP